MNNILKNIKWKYFSCYIIITAITIIFGILSFNGKVKVSTINLFIQIGIAAILAVSLNLVVGMLGELSLGHAGFMCIGAYMGGKTAAILIEPIGNDVITFFIAIIVGGVCAALFGALIGLPALRLKGDYLAIVTLGFGEIVKSIFQNTSKKSFGGALGLSTPSLDGGKEYLFVFCFILLLITLIVIQNLMQSKHGRAITSIRDNEIASRATGINITKYKLLVFTVSSFFAGIAGVLYSYNQFKVQSTQFGFNYSIEILVMVVLGSIGSINGSLISAALITALNTKFSTDIQMWLAGFENKFALFMKENFPVLQKIFYALILMIIIIYGNAPALKNFREKYNIKKLFFKNKKIDPAKVKEDGRRWDVVPTKIPMNEVLSVDTNVESSTLNPDKDFGGK